MKAEILQLAIQGLEYKKSEIEKEIAELEAELKGTRSSDPNAMQSRSERMKVYWAAKRAGAANQKPAPKGRQKTSAERKLISQRMKAAWAKRKAAAAKK
jgi:hypothetical protein